MNDATPAPIDPQPADGKPRRRLTRWIRMPLLILLIGYPAWCGVMYFYQDILVFPRHAVGQPDERLPDPTTVVLTREIEDREQVVAWFLPVPESLPVDETATGKIEKRPLVIFIHGNGELIDEQMWRADHYNRLGCHVLLPEFRGYGRSGGSPSQASIVDDAVYFHDKMVQHRGVDSDRIIIHGHSLGGGVAAQLAARRKPAALILQATFTSVASMAHQYGVPQSLARHPFRTDRVLPTLDVPILILHGTHDKIIPVRHGRTLAELVPDAKYIEYDCDHLNFPGPGNGRTHWQNIRSFLEEANVLVSEQ